jgi:hypothetical protein
MYFDSARRERDEEQRVDPLEEDGLGGEEVAASTLPAWVRRTRQVEWFRYGAS